MISSTGLDGIVVAVDGSAPSKVATDWAAREAAMHHVPLTVVHVIPPPAIAMWPEAAVLEGFSDWRQKHAAKVLDEAKSVAHQAIGDDHPLDIHVRSLVGPTISTLVDVTKDAALVVVGSRGLSAVRRRLLGSVSSGLVHHAHCPVAVIHDEDPLMDRPAQAPVLLGIDGSPASELATAIAFDEASRRGVPLTAMHSWADDELYGWRGGLDWDAQRGEGERALAERLAGWQERYPDVVVERQLIFGDPAEHLLAASEAAQLTVVGSHGRGGFAGMLLGSVSAAVVEAARMPVIVARSS